MKRFILILFLIFILLISSCKKKDIDNNSTNTNENNDQTINNNDNDSNNTNEDNKQTNDDKELNIKFSKDYYVIGEVLEYSSENYDKNNIEVSFTAPNILKLLDNGDYKVQRVGNYAITFTARVDDEIKSIETYDLSFYRNSFELDPTANRIAVGDTCEIRIFDYEQIYESSLDDFNISIDNDTLARIEGFNLIGLAYGDVNVTLTSKLNERVKGTSTIKICDPEKDFMIKPENGNKEFCVGESLKIVFTLDYDITDFNWQSSNKEVIRFTKYDKELEITGVGVGETRISCILKSNPSVKAAYRLKVNGYKDVDYIDKLIKLAYGEVGTWEGKDENGNFNNVQKYGAWYNNNGEPWCATFVSWCWFHAGLSNELLVKYQGCYTGMEWAHEHGIFHDIRGDYYTKEDYNPKSGDIVIFLSNGGGHTGIVGYSDDKYIYTIEGNRSNHVDVWRILKTQSKITGYITPNYPETENRIDQSWLKTDTLPNGNHLWTDVETNSSTY